MVKTIDNFSFKVRKNTEAFILRNFVSNYLKSEILLIFVTIIMNV